MFSILLWAFAFVPTDGKEEQRIPKGPQRLQGKVLDVFDSNKLLLSFGANDGARKGLIGYIGEARLELVEVGANHSVALVDFNNDPFSMYYSPLEKQKSPALPKIGDRVTFIRAFNIESGRSSRRPDAGNERTTDALGRDLPRLQGGAIIDMTAPRK